MIKYSYFCSEIKINNLLTQHYDNEINFRRLNGILTLIMHVAECSK